MGIKEGFLWVFVKTRVEGLVATGIVGRPRPPPTAQRSSLKEFKNNQSLMHLQIYTVLSGTPVERRGSWQQKIAIFGNEFNRLSPEKFDLLSENPLKVHILCYTGRRSRYPGHKSMHGGMDSL